MKKTRKMFITILTAALLALLLNFIALPLTASSLSLDAQICRDLEIIQGGGSGVTDKYMASKCSRLQGAVMLLRLVKKEAAALTYSGGSNFSDAETCKWEQGRNLMSYLKDHPEFGFSGCPDGSFRPSEPFTAQQYYKVLLEVLGYKYNVDFTWNEVFDYAASLGFSSLHGVGTLTMEDVARATIEALTTRCKSDTKTLCEKLVDKGVINKATASTYGLLAGTPGTNMEMLQPENIEYLGAFRLPDDDEWGWSGEALSFDSTGNGGKGSLYGTGHNHRTHVSEISIPEPVISVNISALPRAKTLQPFGNVWENLFNSWYTEIPRIGLEVLDNKLYFCRGEHFQEDNPVTHGYSSLDLSNPNPKGLWKIGDSSNNYATNNYIFKIPQEWSSKYSPGYDLATGRYRDGGWGGMGPSLFMMKTGDLRTGTASINGKEIIRYTDVDDWSGSSRYQVNNYCEADTWTGGAWVCSSAGSAVVFCGNHGFGDNTWYGFANGVVYPIDDVGPLPDVPPYPYDERGWWNNNLRPALMLYSSEDLAKVAQGTMKPYQIQPYDILDISAHTYVPQKDTTMRYLGAMAYDDADQRLFIMELHADGDRPVVHVFGIANGNSQTTFTMPTPTPEPEPAPEPDNNSTSNGTKNLVFIHHSCGENWLSSGEGGGNLCTELNDNGYSVADIYYGWEDASSAGCHGDNTNTVDWPTWFKESAMKFVYSESECMTANNKLSRTPGENEIIMFKSCFPNSDVGSSIADEKAVYNQILSYFKTRQDKMFVLITPPPLIHISTPQKTRELCNWLVDRENGWLENYDGNNVFVFDFYNVLTSPDNHHQLKNGNEAHIIGSSSSNDLYYDSGGDDHPNGIGNKKATEEFVPLLNYWYKQWSSSRIIPPN